MTARTQLSFRSLELELEFDGGRRVVRETRTQTLVPGTRSIVAAVQTSSARLEVTLQIRTVSEANARGHWAGKARRVKQQRDQVGWELLLRRATPPPLPVDVRLVRIAPRELDDDNLRTALKAIRDALAVWLGLPTNAKGLADDRDPRVTWAYGQERGKPHEYAVRLEIASREGGK